jgi:molybdate transport system substrate-binding protein
MDQVRSDGPGVTDQAEFARNMLAVIVPSDNPAHVGSLDDLARPGVKLVLAAVGVPAGDYARGILANAGIQRGALANVVSNEEDVKGVVQKVLLGEADAGIVYRTDVTPDIAARVREITIPDGVNVIATYPIAVIDGSEHAPAAAAFVRFVTGPGQATLRTFGFLPPS